MLIFNIVSIKKNKTIKRSRFDNPGKKKNNLKS